MRTVETKVYPFEELPDEIKEKVVVNMADINVDFEWWDTTYMDAENVGIRLTEFDIGRGSYCRGDFIEDAEEIARKIITVHGPDCETHKTAIEFLGHITEDEDEQAELEADFRRSILEDYRIMLQKDYEYLTGEEAIVITIEANEYEFTVDGKIFS